MMGVWYGQCLWVDGRCRWEGKGNVVRVYEAGRRDKWRYRKREKRSEGEGEVGEGSGMVGRCYDATYLCLLRESLATLHTYSTRHAACYNLLLLFYLL